MTAQTLFFDAYTAYLNLIRETLADTDAVVLDGPQPKLPTSKSYVLVGCDRADQSLAGSLQNAIGSGEQEWESEGASARMETFIIWAVVVAWTGRNDLVFCRNLADSYIDAIGTALRPPPRGTGDAMLGNVLNQNGAGTGWCGYAITSLDQYQDSTGCGVHVQTALTCTARL